MSAIATLADVVVAERGWPPVNLPQSTYEMIARTAQAQPQATALTYFPQASAFQVSRSWTYREFLTRITQAANAFFAMGIGPGDVIAVVLPNLPETHFVYWGGEAAGIVAMINSLLEPASIAELINATGAKVLVTLSSSPGFDICEKIESVIETIETVEHLVLVNLRDSAPAPLPANSALGSRASEVPAFRAPPSITLHSLQAALHEQDGSALASRRIIAGSDHSSYFCTGGTTGAPKIAMRTHGNEIANAWSASQFLDDILAPGKTIFCGLPMFHVNALMVTGLVPFSKGAHVVLGTPQGYRAEKLIPNFWAIVEHFKISSFSGVPTLYGALLQVPTAKHDLSTLKYGICGAAPLPVEIIRGFETKTGAKILEGYGLTEGTCISTVNPPAGETRPGSIGIRMPGQQVKAITLDANGKYLRDAAFGEAGIIAISGANVFDGYLVPEQNNGLWIDTGDGQRWLNTGDLGRQDEQGYFWLTGRQKELIIRGGHNIDPQLIETPLYNHPAILFAAALARPDPHAGELPVAYVQLQPQARVTEAELMEYLRNCIGERAALPKAIRVVERMPMTAVGKLFKPALKQLEIQYAICEFLEESGIFPEAVEARQDKQLGTVVAVTLAPDTDEAKVHTRLQKFTFIFEIRKSEQII